MWRTLRSIGRLAAGAVLGVAAAAQASTPNSGELRAMDCRGRPLGACPLEHTDVTVDVAGGIARVTVTQSFTNPFSDPESKTGGAIEAVYTFPLSDRAAVDRMTMKIGEREIRGVVKEREEARRVYDAARAAGQAASLLDQERPNIFTQSVANILPGQRVDIEISYVEYVKYEDGAYTFSFPMVVGPRYMPGTPQGGGTSRVPDAGRIAPPLTPEGTRAGHDISLTATLAPGLPMQSLKSVLHEAVIEQPEPGRAVVRLKNQKEIPNRDFVLTYAVARESVADAVLAHRRDGDGIFSLTLYPPARVKPEEAAPKEMIFVIDCSGSMMGFPIEKAKAVMKRCIEQLNPRDSFNLLTFAGGLGYCFDKTVPNTKENREKALTYLAKLEGGGGTEMMPAIRAALAGPYDDGRLRMVCFMTDAYIGNDMEILDAVKQNAKHARVFSFGIGNSVNTFLIEQMARMGRGAAEIVTLESESDAAAQRFYERVHSPVLTDIEIDFGGLRVSDVYPDPKALPDLFSEQPLVLTGRYSGGGDGTITVKGRTGAGPFKRSIAAAFPAKEETHDVLAPLWARAAIDQLMAEDWNGIQQGTPKEDVKTRITKLGIDFSLVTQFTSFVAVEDRIINEGGVTRRVEVPVEMPDGVSYEGIIGGRDIAQVQSLGYLGAAPAHPAQKHRLMRIAKSEAVSQAAVAAGSPALPPVEPGRVDQAQNEKDGAGAIAVSDEETAADPAVVAKLDPALQGLAAKVVNGAYQDDAVTVINNVVRVTIHVDAFTDSLIETLKQLGVKVIAQTRASNRILAEIRVGDLEAVAALKEVTRIAPVR